MQPAHPVVHALLSCQPMLPSRWSHLVRYGLIGTSLLAAGAPSAHADDCDDVAEGTVAFVVGLEMSPKIRLVGGVEARRCLDHKTEALIRLELGGGSPRLIGGARVRPLEDKYSSDDLELVGVEAGGILDFRGKLGVHLAGTYGTHSAYLALQAHIKISEEEQPTRWTALAGFAPWTAYGPTVVEGRPVTAGHQLIKPAIARLPAAHTAAARTTAARTAARAIRDHFVSSAQLELSSVWTFLRLAAELAAVGAPAHLITAALDAADDEVRHAMLCARAAGGLALAALSSSLAQPRFTARSPYALALLAAEAWCEGCLNETAAAEEARLAADRTSGERRAMLETIAHDEAGHAELSWAVLTWLYSVAPDVTRAALAQIPRLDPIHDPHDAPALDLAEDGVPTSRLTAAARAHAESVARARLTTLT